MADKYDEAIAYLTARPHSEILKAWAEPTRGDDHPAHCLFQSCGHTGRVFGENADGCLCLTQLRAMPSHAEGELQIAITNDERIPSNQDAITLAHLPVFAEWQRRIDKELNRT